jgi:hypothetical protein
MPILTAQSAISGTMIEVEVITQHGKRLGHIIKPTVLEHEIRLLWDGSINGKMLGTGNYVMIATFRLEGRTTKEKLAFSVIN